MNEHPDDHIQPDTDEEDEFFEEEIDFDGAVCSGCWAALDKGGYCTNDSCKYANY